MKNDEKAFYKKVDYWILIAFIIFGLLVTAIGYLADWRKCDSQWKNTEYEFDYSMKGGCRINVPGLGWVPSKNLFVKQVVTVQIKDKSK